MPCFVFVAGLSLGPRAAAAGAIAFLVRATKDSYAVDCARPALSRILLNHLRPAIGWLGCRTRTFLNILPLQKKKRNSEQGEKTVLSLWGLLYPETAIKA
jgi:hypothetical protein